MTEAPERRYTQVDQTTRAWLLSTASGDEQRAALSCAWLEIDLLQIAHASEITRLRADHEREVQALHAQYLSRIKKLNKGDAT